MSLLLLLRSPPSGLPVSTIGTGVYDYVSTLARSPVVMSGRMVQPAQTLDGRIFVAHRLRIATEVVNVLRGRMVIRAAGEDELLLYDED